MASQTRVMLFAAMLEWGKKRTELVSDYVTTVAGNPPLRREDQVKGTPRLGRKSLLYPYKSK